MNKLLSKFDMVYIEYILASIIIIGNIYSIIFLIHNNYLPQPFFYEPNDTFADWFNTAYWARDPGTYDVWTSLYPPISFVFLRLFGIDSCYPRGRIFESSPGLAVRECDWIGLGSIFAFYVIDVILTYRVLRKVDRRTAIPRTVCVGMGFPILDGLERGNLVLVAYLAFLLATGPLLRSARLRWLCAGIAVNFKVYLIAPFAALLVKRRWKQAESILIATIIVYAISYAILGRGSPIEIFTNIMSWTNQTTAQPLDLWFSTTYHALVSLLEGDTFPMVLIIGSRTVDLLVMVLPALLRITQGLVLLTVAAVWFRPESVSPLRVITLGLMLALISSEGGGYTPVYYSFLVMMERWRGFGVGLSIIICYIIAIPLDIFIDQMQPIVRDTYLNHSTTIVTFYLTAGPFVRPLLIQVIAIALAATTLRTVWLDLRSQGWSNRWRFRHDAPLLPWVARPRPPTAMQ